MQSEILHLTRKCEDLEAVNQQQEAELKYKEESLVIEQKEKEELIFQIEDLEKELEHL